MNYKEDDFRNIVSECVRKRSDREPNERKWEVRISENRGKKTRKRTEKRKKKTVHEN